MASKRQDTRLESEGAEFLVLGQLLIAGITANKAYRNMPDYDIVATNPATKRSASISVKSRWRTNAEGFILKSCECDFVVLVKLNRGSKDGRLKVLSPEFFVPPATVIRDVPRSAKWNKVSFKSIPKLNNYRDQWPLISEFLKAERAY